MSAQRRAPSRNGRHTSTGTPKSPASGGLSYPTIRQRGYYSDILGEGSKEELGVSLSIIEDPTRRVVGVYCHLTQ